MSWWVHSQEKTLFYDESYFPSHYPRHVARAFISVSYDDRDSDALNRQRRPYFELMLEAAESFAQRWGGLDDAIFVRVLQEGSGRDRLAAMFAIGHSTLPQAMDLLAPFLHSADQLERCAAACCLGLKRDERALPILEEYLLCEPPKDEQGKPVLGAKAWYNLYRANIARQLATWGPSSFTPILRKSLLLILEKERVEKRKLVERNTHDALLYALGSRGALGALHGIILSARRRRLAMIYLALGWLQADEQFQDIEKEMKRNPALKEEVATVLAERFALTEGEIQKTISSFWEDSERRQNPFFHEQDEDDEEK